MRRGGARRRKNGKMAVALMGHIGCSMGANGEGRHAGGHVVGEVCRF